MILKLITDRDNYIDSIKELKEEWLLNLLTFLGIKQRSELDYNDAEYVQYLLGEKIEIITYPSFDGIRVQYKNEIVGEWGGPEFHLKKEGGKFFYYIEIECWSISDSS